MPDFWASLKQQNGDQDISLISASETVLNRDGQNQTFVFLSSSEMTRNICFQFSLTLSLAGNSSVWLGIREREGVGGGGEMSLA